MNVIDLYELANYNADNIYEYFLSKIEALEKELEALKAEKGGK